VVTVKWACGAVRNAAERATKVGMGGGAVSLAALRGAGRMAAWRTHAYGAAELRLEAARVPPLRAPDHVLVRVHAASINPLDVAMLGQRPNVYTASITRTSRSSGRNRSNSAIIGSAYL
jgi:hypothetical protein